MTYSVNSRLALQRHSIHGSTHAPTSDADVERNKSLNQKSVRYCSRNRSEPLFLQSISRGRSSILVMNLDQSAALEVHQDGEHRHTRISLTVFADRIQLALSFRSHPWPGTANSPKIRKHTQNILHRQTAARSTPLSSVSKSKERTSQAAPGLGPTHTQNRASFGMPRRKTGKAESFKREIRRQLGTILR